MEPQKINGKSKIGGLLGFGISYSLSPTIHNAAARYLRRNAVYLPFDLPTPAIPDLLRGLWAADAWGLNVTQPHKSYVAELIGSDLISVNTIYRGQEGWKATSTDGEGLDRGLKSIGTSLLAFGKVVILGDGGAAIAICEYLQRSTNLQKLILLSRNPGLDAKSSWTKLGSKLPLCFDHFSPAALSAHLANEAEGCLLIQATSAPLKGNDLREFAQCLPAFKGVVVDLNYHLPSRLFLQAKSQGLSCQDGLPMLIEQARIAQELWWGESAPSDIILLALQEELSLAQKR